MIDNNDSKACRIRGHLTIHGHLDELEITTVVRNKTDRGIL